MRPTRNLLEGFQRMEDPWWYPWDDYHAQMAQTDYLEEQAEIFAVKSFFVREAPFGGSYMLFGGLTQFLRHLNAHRFDKEICVGLAEQGFREDWVRYLCGRKRLKIGVRSHREGSILLPNEPAVTVWGNLHDVRLVEGMIYRACNPGTLWLTKWHRIIETARPANVTDFGMRRAQDPNRSTVYSYLAGADGTSNAEIRRWWDIPLRGTMGHEKVQANGDEYAVFDSWLEHNQHRPVLLVDTINTLESGLPNAISAFKKQWDKIKKAGARPAIRIDSGDLAYLSLASIKMLDEAGLEEVGIILTNNLDEYTIEKIKNQLRDSAHRFGLVPDAACARILVYAVGTMGATCFDQPALGGVAKIMEVETYASIKLSENNPQKTSIPGNNSSAFIFRGNELLGAVLYPVNIYCVKDGRFYRKGRLVSSLRVLHPHDGTRAYTIKGDDNIMPRQYMPYDGYSGDWFTGEWENPTLDTVRQRVRDESARLDWSHRRVAKSHEIRVSLVPELFRLRQNMIEQKVLREDLLR